MAASRLTDRQRARVDALFDAALDLAPEARVAWALAETVEDEAARDALLALLRADARAHGVLEQVPSVPVAEALASARVPDPLLETQLGAWRLVAEIGRGGMGTVYHAERADAQFTLAAAVKILPHRAVSPSIVRRFVAERQILASLEHPLIARILDGGVADDGRPWFAMELVQGEPIDRYCESRELDLQTRLRLFSDVCRVVAYAHSRLVIHRDLKPGNVLVTREGTIKLVDFGIATLVRPVDAAESDGLQTAGTHALTPAYASPEQLSGDPVTTATDIHGLGLILWELLAGRPLHRITAPDTASAAGATLAALLAPPPPSAHAPATRRRAVAGDLDGVTLRALAPEPGDRYRSVEALLGDVERFLSSRPVLARDGGVVHRSRLFAARNPAVTLAASALVVVLVAYAATVTAQTRRVERALAAAQQAAVTADRTTQFLVGLFENSSPGALLGESITARQLLDRGQVRVEALSAEPVVQSALLDVLGRVYASLGEYPRAESLLTRALAGRRRVLGDSHTESVRTQAQLASVLQAQARDSAATDMLRAALASYAARAGGVDVVAAGLLNQLARLRVGAGDARGAERLADSALMMAVPGAAADTSRARSFEVKAMVRGLLNDLPGSERHVRTALALRRAALPAMHPDVLRSMGHLARSAAIQGRAGDAARAYAELVPLQRRVLGDSHPNVAVMRNNLSTALMALHEFDAALQERRTACGIERAKLGAAHPTTINSLLVLGEFEYEAGRPDEAIVTLRAALGQARAQPTPDRDGVASAHASYAMALADRGRLADAGMQLRALAAQAAADSGAIAVRAHHLRAAAWVAHAVGARDTALAQLARAVTLLGAAYGERDVRVTEHQFRLAQWLAQSGARAAAESLHRQVLATRRAHLPATSRPVRESQRALATLPSR